MLHKKYFVRALLGVTLLSCGFSTIANAEQLPYEEVQITDPLVLESMGFPPDAENVFKRVPRSGIKGLELQANSFGNKDANFTSYLGRSSFDPVFGRYPAPGSTSRFRWGFSNQRMRCVSTSSYSVVDAIIQLPSGVLLEGFRWWGHDSSSEDIQFNLASHCLPPFAADSVGTFTALAIGSSSGNAGDASEWLPIPGGEVVDNLSCAYTLNVQLDDSPFDCTHDGELSFEKARFQWRRQISPAPALASFTDVPVGHTFFKEIEAMSASGITGGCGGTLYCPDANLTRGQMAAFMARALGLHWGSDQQD